MLDLLRTRRSIRRFKDRTIEPEVIAQLQEAILRSPSSRGISPWRFVFVTDPALLERLARVKTHGAGFLAQARLGIAIGADETESDVWIEDCAIAGIIVQLAATSLGLGSCWVQIRNRNDGSGHSSEELVRQILGLDPHLRVDTVIAVGYPAQTPPPVPTESLHWDRISAL